MRVIEEKMLKALSLNKSMKCGNTEVEFHTDGGWRVYLHGNCIAKKNASTGTLSFTSAGWCSNTTKSRLNALMRYFHFEPIYQKDWEWFWDSHFKKVDNFPTYGGMVYWYTI